MRAHLEASHSCSISFRKPQDFSHTKMLLLVSRFLGCTAYYPHHFGFRFSQWC
jgi:hypothetical protein